MAVVFVVSIYYRGYRDGLKWARKQKPVGTITQPVKVVTQAKDIWEHAGKFTYSDMGNCSVESAPLCKDLEERNGHQRRYLMTFAGGTKDKDNAIDYTIHPDFHDSERNVGRREDGGNDAD